LVLVSFEMEIPGETLVIPAKAGIHSCVGTFPITCGVDSRLRGNDGTWERPILANDTTTKNLKEKNLAVVRCGMTGYCLPRVGELEFLHF